MNGRVVHFELPMENAERAQKFYSTVFGWKLNPMPEFNYTMVSTGPLDENMMPKEPGYIGGGMGKREGHLSHPVVTIGVEEITTAEKTIEQHGGKILQRKTPIGDGSMGYTGYFKDPEGNVVGLYQPGKM